ncbi:MAG: ribonuclease D [Thermogutta sp.]|nr:ribonuclease D [Thermogutta sp.]
MTEKIAAGDQDISYSHRIISTPHDFQAFCRALRGCPRLALDTEFVAEDSYHPNLCLVQVALDNELVLIDPFPLGSVSAFWETIVGEDVETVVHAGHVDLQFCYFATGRFPPRVFDVQIAAGLAGADYPSGLTNLIQKYVGDFSPQHETQSDWRRRPLSEWQIVYALDDVRFLLRLRDRLDAILAGLGRRSWLGEEVVRHQHEIQKRQESERWQRLAGHRALSARELAILRELWLWREERASYQNVPARRILRDDLLVELAKRKTGDVKRILAVRGMNFRHIRPWIPDIAERIRRALAIPEENLPRPERREGVSQSPLVGQFLFTALGSLCRRGEISVGLVGSTQDIRDWVSYRLGEGDEEPPLMAQGWRRELIGDLFDRLLSGKAAIRIRDAKSDHPLEFVEIPDEEPPADSGAAEGCRQDRRPAP